MENHSVMLVESNIQLWLGGKKTKKMAGGSRLTKTYRRIREADGKCCWCPTGSADTVDHVIPKSRGGSNKQTNLVGCCRDCNAKKGDKLPKELGWVLRVPLRFFNHTVRK